MLNELLEAILDPDYILYILINCKQFVAYYSAKWWAVRSRKSSM